MSKTLEIILTLFTSASVVLSCACAHKPAYSDIDVNRNSRNQNAGEQLSTQAPPNSDSGTVKMPAFLAPNGSIMDLPSYPRSSRVNVQIGPVQGADTMALTLRTRDTMENIQAFYEKAIKENRWTVADKVLDPEVSVWSLKKDDNNEARVQAKKESGTVYCDIFLIRTQKVTPDTK